MKEGKPFEISKHQMLEAYKRVKANHGAGGIDEMDFTEFEKDFKSNLYKLWNRMSSGSYFPLPVRGVEIPKKKWKEKTSWHTYDNGQSGSNGGTNEL